MPDVSDTVELVRQRRPGVVLHLYRRNVRRLALNDATVLRHQIDQQFLLRMLQICSYFLLFSSSITVLVCAVLIFAYDVIAHDRGPIRSLLPN